MNGQLYWTTLQESHCIPCLELLGTKRMCDILNRVTQAMSVVVGWVDTPGGV